MAKRTTTQSEDIIIDGLGSDPSALEDNIGAGGRILISALDRAVSLQTSLISNYITRLRRRHPEDTPAQLQERIDTHFLRLATGAGAGVGATASVPGIGLLAATAAIGAESLVFLDAAAFYTMASAQLRGADITNPERRRALILIALLGARGTAVVDTFVGDISQTDPQAAGIKGMDRANLLNRFSVPTLSSLNNRLLRVAIKRVGRRLTRGWLGKIMPLGIGAIAGTVVNRRIAHDVIGNVSESLGSPPAEFHIELAQLPEVPEEQAEEIDALDADTSEDEDSGDDGDDGNSRWKFWKRG